MGKTLVILSTVLNRLGTLRIFHLPFKIPKAKTQGQFRGAWAHQSLVSRQANRRAGGRAGGRAGHVGEGVHGSYTAQHLCVSTPSNRSSSSLMEMRREAVAAASSARQGSHLHQK